MKKLKKVILIVIAFIIGISTTVTAATVFNSKDITYSSDKTEVTNVKDSLDELYSKVGKCPDGWHCYTSAIALSDKVELGDYIRMTPTSTSYTPPSELTGCTADVNCTQNTLNPSELNLWRVIKKNSDGTVDMISEKTSSTHISFNGIVGYRNYIGALKIISSQYKNDKYTMSTKVVGYEDKSNICLNITDCPVFTTFLDEINLIETILGTMKTTDEITNYPSYYWIAGRYPWGTPAVYIVNCIEINGSWGSYVLVDSDGIEHTVERSFRPILTLKSNIEVVSGDGKSAETAYELS